MKKKSIKILKIISYIMAIFVFGLVIYGIITTLR